MLYLRDDIPCKQLKIQESPAPIKAIFIEMDIRKSKWLLVVGYNPHEERIASFLSDVSNASDKYLAKYENIIILGDFNSETNETHMKFFASAMI